MRRLRRSGVWLVLLLGACGGSADVVAPTTTTPTTTTTTTGPTTTPTTPATTTSTTTTSLATGTIQERSVAAPGSSIAIRFDAELAPGLLSPIEETLPVARGDFGDSGSLVVHVYGSGDNFVSAHDVRSQQRARDDVEAGIIASSGPGAIWIYGPRYAERDSTTRRLIVLHEYFHTVQLSLSSGRSSRAPLWLREGTARYFELRAGADHRYTDFSRRRETNIRQSRGLDPLQSFETRGGPTFRGDSGEAYTLGFLASEYLLSTNDPATLKRDLWVALRSSGDWRIAFNSVFGVSVDQFYADFEAYRLTL